MFLEGIIYLLCVCTYCKPVVCVRDKLSEPQEQRRLLESSGGGVPSLFDDFKFRAHEKLKAEKDDDLHIAVN